MTFSDPDADHEHVYPGWSYSTPRCTKCDLLAWDEMLLLRSLVAELRGEVLDEPEQCLAVGPEGFICTLPNEHPREHEAWGGDKSGKPFRTWPDPAAEPDLLTFDSTDEGPNQKLVDYMRSHYWVAVGRHEEARGDEWLRSPSRPIDVPNGTMIWRRPTYGEILNHLDWLRRKLPIRNDMSYRRVGEVPPLCTCGHGEDSHRENLLRLPGTPQVSCRMSCYCCRFTVAS